MVKTTKVATISDSKADPTPDSKADPTPDSKVEPTPGSKAEMHDSKTVLEVVGHKGAEAGPDRNEEMDPGHTKVAEVGDRVAMEGTQMVVGREHHRGKEDLGTKEAGPEDPEEEGADPGSREKEGAKRMPVQSKAAYTISPTITSLIEGGDPNTTTGCVDWKGSRVSEINAMSLLHTHFLAQSAALSRRTSLTTAARASGFTPCSHSPTSS